jgi:hypothetical protein
MLAINGKPLSEMEKTDPLAIYIRSALAKIKQKKMWTLVFHESKVMPIKVEVGEAGGRYETSAGIISQAKGKYSFDGMEHDITYYKTINIVKDEKRFYPSTVDFSGTITIDPKKQADLLFYMTCVLNSCAEYDHISKFQDIKPGKDIFYKVEDIEMDAALSNVSETKIAKIGSLIYDSDFGLKENILRELAVSHGVADAIDIDVELLRQNLKRALLSKTRGQYDIKKINAFLDDVKDNSLIRLRALIEKAVNDNIIIIAPNSSKKDSWFDVDKDGNKRVRIMTIPENSDAKTSLVKHYAKKPDDRAAFEKYVENGGGGKAIVVKTSHIIEDA